MRFALWLKILLSGFIIIVFLMIFWNWDWFIPFVDARATAALGHDVKMQHLHLALGRRTEVTATGLTIDNPNGFPADEPKLATVARLAVTIDVVDYIFHRQITVPAIAVDEPVFNLRQLPSGQTNFAVNTASGGTGKPPRLGTLTISDGRASVVLPADKSDFTMTIATRAAPRDSRLFTGGEIVLDARGTYAGAPITGQFIGGALLSLRDASVPYPVDLHVQNGTTVASLAGTIDDPRDFAGAHLRLSFAGQDMANLYQLTGVPIPATPPFSVTGILNYAGGAFRFDKFTGRVGSSDVEGSIAEIPATPRRQIVANLQSRYVDLTDLAGFLGGTPGKTTTPGQDAATKEKVVQAVASPRLLPDTPVNLPRINIADIDLRYHGAHIINRDVPLDNLTVHLVIRNGRITVDPLDFAVGTGTIASNVDLNPVDGVLHARANIDFRRLQLSRLMAATHAFAGDGTVGGSADVAGSGNSVATILGHGNGHATLFLQHGGDLSALLVDLAGLQFGDAVLSALGLPVKTKIQCMVSDFGLTDGTVDTRTFLIATPEANILGSGTANLDDEKLDMALHTQATHLSIGSLSTPINIGGTLKNPSVLPAIGPLAARIGPAIGLGVLFPPLALLPTIRLGLGDKNACEDAIAALHEGK
jgi:AsmA family protein